MNPDTKTSGSSATALIAKLSRYTSETLDSSSAERNEAIELRRNLTAALEGPVNRATELVFKVGCFLLSKYLMCRGLTGHQPFITIVARIAVGMDLFASIVAADGKSITSKELAQLKGGEEIPISRVLRMLASVDFVEQDGPYDWRANDTTRAMASAPISAGHRFVFDTLVSSAIFAPKYLKETDWKSPTEPLDGFVQYSKQTKLNIFDYLLTQPSLFQFVHG